MIKKILLKRFLKKTNIKVRINLKKKKHSLLLEEECSLGDLSLIGNSTHFLECGFFSYFRSGTCIGSIKIGRFCSIAEDVIIGLEKNGHPLDWLSTSPFQFSSNSITKLSSNFFSYSPNLKTTSIGHDVWIGNRVIIYNGCDIGIGAIIATGSIVTSPVPPYAIAAGIPAKIIGYRFPKDEVAVLLNSQWWEASRSELANLTYSDKEHFIEEVKNIKPENTIKRIQI